MRGKAKNTLPQDYCISLPRDTTLGTRIVFARMLFQLCVSFSVMDGKIEHVCNKVCVKLGNSATKTLEMLRAAFGEH
jgi:hypothetical protein